MQRIKAVAAGLGGLLMAGATLMTPVLAEKTIGEAFSEMNPENTIVVVGENAAVADVVGAIAVAAELGQHGATAVGGGTTELEGVEEQDVNLYDSVYASTKTLDDGDLAGLQDTSVDWNDEDIDIEERVEISSDLKIFSGLSDEDMGANIYMGTANKGAIIYYVDVKDSDFNYSEVSEDEPLEIKVAGKSLKIVKVEDDGSNDEITYEEGKEVALGVGGSVEVDGKTVKVEAIGQDSIEVSVDGESEFIEEHKESEVGDSGIKVEVKNILYNGDNPDASRVLIKVGKDITKTIKNGDSAELFGEPEDSDDAEWVWYIDAVDGDVSELKIGLKHNQRYDNADEDVKGVGEGYALPNDYVKVMLHKLSVNDEGYATIETSFESVDVDVLENGNNAPDNDNYDDVSAWVLKADKKIFNVEVNGDIKDTDTIYVLEGNSTYNVRLAFKNNDGDVQMFYEGNLTGGWSEGVTFDYRDNDASVLKFQNASQYTMNVFNMALVENEGATLVDTVYVSGIDVANERIGDTDDEAKAEEVVINDGTDHKVGTKEESMRTPYGSIIVEPKSKLEADEFEIKVPEERVQATVRVYGPSSTVSVEGSANINFKSVSPSMAKMDSEVSSSDKASKNLILVGGPAINSLVAELADEGKTLTLDQWRSDYVNKAIVQVVEDAFASGEVALVVAGYEAQDTQNAVAKLISGAVDHKSAVVLSGDTISDLNLEQASQEEQASEEEEEGNNSAPEGQE